MNEPMHFVVQSWQMEQQDPRQSDSGLAPVCGCVFVCGFLCVCLLQNSVLTWLLHELMLLYLHLPVPIVAVVVVPYVMCRA